MNSGINFDIMYELACGRVVVITSSDTDGSKQKCYWVSDNGKLVRCDEGRYGNVHSITIPWGDGYKFSLEERDYKNQFTNY